MEKFDARDTRENIAPLEHTNLCFLGTSVDSGAAQALVVETLGMAARSAGFAVPGALVVQEAGFMLAAGAAGLPPSLGLGLSLVKRIREIVVGLGGLALWRLER